MDRRQDGCKKDHYKHVKGRKNKLKWPFLSVITKGHPIIHMLHNIYK